MLRIGNRSVDAASYRVEAPATVLGGAAHEDEAVRHGKPMRQDAASTDTRQDAAR